MVLVLTADSIPPIIIAHKDCSMEPCAKAIMLSCLRLGVVMILF